MPAIRVLFMTFIVVCGWATAARAVCNPPCDPNAMCIANVCQCNPGYMGNGVTCTEINACLMMPCDPHATCTKTGPGTYACTCNLGYQGNGKTCAPINPCLQNPC